MKWPGLGQTGWIRVRSAQRHAGPTPHSVGAEEGPGQVQRKENLAFFFLPFKFKNLVSD